MYHKFKFKLGDRAILKNRLTQKNSIGDKCEITSIKKFNKLDGRFNKLDGRFNKPTYSVRILGDIFSIPGVYEDSLEIDLEYHRDKKLEELGI